VDSVSTSRCRASTFRARHLCDPQTSLTTRRRLFCLLLFRESVATLSEFSSYIDQVDTGQRAEMQRLQALASDEMQRQNDVVNATKTQCEEQLMHLQLQFEDVSFVVFGLGFTSNKCIQLYIYFMTSILHLYNIYIRIEFSF